MTGHDCMAAFYNEGTGRHEYLPNRRGAAHPAVTDEWFPPGTDDAPATADLGFHFTPGELAAIHSACADAAEYMRGYGKGRRPAPIDRSRYYNSLPAPVDAEGGGEETEETDETQ